MAGEKKMKLNQQQQAAVKYQKGPLLIIAGAGTGKTTVITERIKHLITKIGVKSSAILALTFTDKAAREMEERVDLVLPYGLTDMWLMTFHAFCDRVLRQETLQIGLDPRYKLMTQAETTQFLINNLFKFRLKYFRPLANPTKFIDGLRQHFSRLKDEDVTPKQYLDWAKKSGQSPSLELAQAYQVYEALKIENNVMDFGDLISHTLNLFRKRPGVLQQYQKQFEYFLVDEFQDTNISQNELVRLLAGKKANLTVVCDDDQSIYKWRGAAISNVIQFRKYFPQVKLITLTQNYRSTQEILDKAYQVIQNNNPDRLEVKEKIDKKLAAVRKIQGKPIKFIQRDRVENEAEAVVKIIKNLIKRKKHQYRDFAILVRANNHAESFGRALSQARLPYQFLGPGQLFHQSEVKDLIAYLKLLDNFENNVALYRVLSLDHFDFSGRDLAAIINFSRRQNFSFFEACEQADKIILKPKTQSKIKTFVQMVHRHLDLLARETAGQILYYFFKDSGLLKKMTEYKTEIEEKQGQNMAKFFDRLKSYETNHEDASVAAVVAWLDLSLELGESPLASDLDWTEENKVNLLTIHSAKGLEFPIVFLVNLVTGRFPSRRRSEQIPIPEQLIKEVLPEGDYHLQEERRLFYVGMTRAKNQLFLTAANYYGEAKRVQKISPFVIEALGKEVIKKPESKKSQQLSFSDIPREIPSKVEGRSGVNFLSFSQIDTFDTCPLQYQYRYLKRIPVSDSAALNFGRVIHQVLNDFYQLVQKNQKPTKKELLTLLTKNWSPVGYKGKTHEQKMKKEAQKMLLAFYQKGYQPDQKILTLEKDFVIKLNADLKIRGKIDRVDQVKNGLEIIDYKTGGAWEQKRVDKSLQMTTYALAMASENVILSFYFLQTGEKKSTRRTAEDLVKAKQELIKKAKQISQSDFQPTPGLWCRFCDFRLICEAWR